MKIKIFGAGSIGNHLAQASRRAGWDVSVVDRDPKALERMRTDIYPKRYGAWDNAIGLFTTDKEPKGGFDVVFIGTPPHVRLDIAMDVLKEKPRLIQLEKPAFPPFMGKKEEKRIGKFLSELKAGGTRCVVGYEYVLGSGVKQIEDFISSGGIGTADVLEVAFRENWSGILKAHSWLSGPQDSYLGFWKKGGGASGEHSHAIHFWQHFSDISGLGKISEVSSSMDMVKNESTEFDKACFMTVRTDRGFLGRIVQDVVTEPFLLSMRIQGNLGFAEWKKYLDKDRGVVEEINLNSVKYVRALIRPDDFFHEIQHIGKILDGTISAEASPISIDSGISALAVLTAAHKSDKANSAFQKVVLPAAA